MAACGLSLQLGSSESCKTVKQKYIFQIGTFNTHGINECLSFAPVPLTMFPPTNIRAPFFSRLAAYGGCFAITVYIL